MIKLNIFYRCMCTNLKIWKYVYFFSVLSLYILCNIEIETIMMVVEKIVLLIFSIHLCGVLSGKQDTSRCIKDLNEVTTGLKNKEIWAMKSKYEIWQVWNKLMWNFVVIDSSAKIPIGIFEGNFNDNGNFDECLAVKDDKKDIRGQHCMLKLRLRKEILDVILEDMLSKMESINSRVEIWINHRNVLMIFVLAYTLSERVSRSCFVFRHLHSWLMSSEWCVFTEKYFVPRQRSNENFISSGIRRQIEEYNWIIWPVKFHNTGKQLYDKRSKREETLAFRCRLDYNVKNIRTGVIKFLIILLQRLFQFHCIYCFINYLGRLLQETKQK